LETTPLRATVEAVTRWLGVAGCVAALFAAGSTAALRAAPPTGPGAVVFVGDRPGPSGDAATDIYRVNLDGSGLTRLTHNGQAESPLPSPDGKLIAFNGSNGMAVMNRDGSNQHDIAGCYSVGSWAPDSQRIACRTGAEGLGVVDLARGTLGPLSSTGAGPAWSPDGRSIAYADDGLWIADVSSGHVRRISRRAVDGAASWSPDSAQLVFAVQTATSHDLYVVHADGSGEQRIARGVEELGAQAWSPTDSRIVFVRYLPHGPEAIYTVRADGTGLRLVSGRVAGEAVREPAWSADGKLLLYDRQRYSLGDNDIAVTPAGGGTSRRVTEPFPAGGSNDEPRWLPGPRLPVPAPKRPPTIALPKMRALTFAPSCSPSSSYCAPLHVAAADGARALVVPDGCTFVVWAPLARAPATRRRLCAEAPIQEFVLSGGRLAWLASTSGNTEYHTELRAAPVGAREARIYVDVSAFGETASSSFDSGASVFGVAGGGGTIAFTFTRYRPTEQSAAWLLLSRRSAKCPGAAFHAPPTCRRLAAGAAVAADASRVAVLTPGGVLRLLTTSGHVLRTIRLDRTPDAVRLDGRAVVVQLGSKVLVYGTSKRAWQLAGGEGAPTLADARGGLVVYTTGGAIHVLDTTTARDRALALPRAAPPLDARLTARGLFLVWNRMDDPRPGRVSFVPLRKLLRAVRG
jgi:WD40-like Beta Propeller Repeat